MMSRFETRTTRRPYSPASLGRLGVHVLLGAIVGTLVLHPLTKAIYGTGSLTPALVVAQLRSAFGARMLPMTGAFALLGAALGLGFGMYHRLLARHTRVVGFLEAELARSVTSLVAAGESEDVEFKASARWDFDRDSVNRELEHGVVRTIAGLQNHTGGSLLLGVDDAGIIRGLQRDYQTLRRSDRDGYERFLTELVRTRLGGDVCPLVHVTFHRVGDHEICRVIVEPSSRPVYIEDHGTYRFMLRTGNSTRELDVREATEYIPRRFGTTAHNATGTKPREQLSRSILQHPSSRGSL